MRDHFPPHRIATVGCSDSRKSTHCGSYVSAESAGLASASLASAAAIMT